MNTVIIEFIKNKNWKYELRGDQAFFDFCPLPNCGKDKNHFNININTGQFFCFKCGQKGTSLKQLKYLIGDENYNSRLTEVVKIKKEFPDYRKFHNDLMLDHNADALDYLVCERGFSYQTIEKQMLGVTTQFFSKPNKMCKCISIPYFKDDKCVFIKYRTIPPEEKDFCSTETNDIPLYNQNIIKEGMDELVLTEGEFDVLSLLSSGYESVVGVPGANIKKTSWFNLIDKASPKKIIFCYDQDKTGQQGAKDIAVRLGKLYCTYNIKLPDFEKADGQKGKDVNDLLRMSGGYEKFLELKENAKLFEIVGVHSLVDVVNSLEYEFDNNDFKFKPTLDTPWPSLTKLIGGVEYGDLVAVTGMAGIGKSRFSINWLDYYVRTKELNCFNFCLEMPVKRVGKLWISMISGQKEENINKDCFNLSREIMKESKGEFLLGFTQFKKVDEIFETIWQVKKRNGLNVVCFDNLHLLTRSVDNKTSEIDVLSKRFKQLAMELNMAIILIVQPTKGDKNSVVSIYDARGSAAIVQDADTGMSIHRNRKVNPTQQDFSQLGHIDSYESFEPFTLIDVGKARWAAGGQTTLLFNGELSTFTEMLNNGAPTSAQEYEKRAIII